MAYVDCEHTKVHECNARAFYKLKVVYCSTHSSWEHWENEYHYSDISYCPYCGHKLD
jgi:hypothetical protein